MIPTGSSVRYAYYFADAVWTGCMTLDSAPHVKSVKGVHYILVKQGLNRSVCHTVVPQHDGLEVSILSPFLESTFVHQCLAGVSCLH